MHRRDQTEVLVVGAGPVGMVTALLLTKSGVGVRIIDQEPRTVTHGCACALHPHTLKLLSQLGLMDSVRELGQRIDTIALYEGRERRAELRLSELPAEFPFVIVMSQSALESLLEQKLARAGCAVHWNSRLSDLKTEGNSIKASIDKLTETATGYSVPEWSAVVDKTHETDAKFVIGADGCNSRVRQCLGIEYEVTGDPECFAAYEFQCEARCDHEMRIVLADETASVMWPFSEHRCRWSFQVAAAESPSGFPEKDRQTHVVSEPPGENDSRHQLQQLLAERAPWFDRRIAEIEWTTRIQFEYRLASRFGVNCCWLAGDAAHQTGPIGMQSVNVGLREGADLAERITNILRGSASMSLVESYASERRADWQLLLGLKGLPKARKTANAWIEAHRAKIPVCLPASGEDLASLLNQLGLTFNVDR